MKIVGKRTDQDGLKGHRFEAARTKAKRTAPNTA